MPLTPLDYISHPKYEGALPRLGESRSLAVMNKLLSRRAFSVFTKWRHVKEIRRVLLAENILSDFTLKLLPTLKPLAFMHDGGTLSLSLGLLLTRTPWVVLSVYLHELAHIWLAGEDNYPDVKALAREVKRLIPTHPLGDRISPIELYADTVTLAMLEALDGTTVHPVYQKRLERLISERRDRIAAVEDALGEVGT